MTPDTGKSNSKQTPDITITDILENAPVGFLIFDSDGVITTLTSNFFSFGVMPKMLGVELAGMNILTECIFADLEIKQELVELTEGDGFEKIVSKKRSINGGEVCVIMKGTPIIIDDKFGGGFLMIEDIQNEGDTRQEELKNSPRFHGFLQNVSDYFLIMDTRGEILYKQTESYASKYDNLASNIKKSRPSIFSFGQKNVMENLLSRLNETSETVNDNVSLNIKGDEYIFNTSLIPFLSPEDEVQFVIVLFKDVSEEINAQLNTKNEITELRKYQHITSTIVDALITTDMAGKINYWNEPATELFGFTRSEIYGKSISKVINTIDKNFIESVKAELRNTKIWEGQLRLGDDNDSEVLWTRIGIIGEKDDKSIVILCSNITKRAISERALKLSEEKFRNIVTNTHEFICTLDLKGNITYINPHFQKTFGYSEDEFLKLNFRDLISEQYFKTNNFKIDIKTVVKLESIELPLVTKDNAEVYVLASFTTVRDFNGKASYFNVVLTDISGKKDSQKDLLLIRSVFEASQEGIIVTCNRKVILANDYFVQMFGYDNIDEVIGSDPLDYVDEKDIPLIAKYIKALEKQSEAPPRYDFIGKKKDESEFYVENSVTTYEMDDEIYIVSVLRDVTENRRAKQIMEESEARYRNISENIDECMWTAERVNGKLKVVFYTAAIKKITGYPYKDFITNARLWFEITHPDDSSEVIQKLKRLYRDDAKNYDNLEYRIINKLGNTIWIRNKINIIRDKKGAVSKIFGLVSDITLRKKAEADMSKFTENLKQLNDTKDRFISIISHDLRTPFGSIMGFTDLLLKDESITDEKQRQYITFIKESSANMLALVNSLLDWTRLQTGRIKFEPERINSKVTIMKSIQMLAGSAIQKNIQLESKVESDLFVHADESLLMQLLNNLISNAIKFTKEGGYIWVTAEPVIEKKHVLFSVKDNGVGIKVEDMDKLFKVDTKFTSNGTEGEKGSGLGLSLCKDIAQKHGGDIWVKSVKGEGTEFFFSIPISSTKILIVDDLNTDRLLYSKLLKSFLPDYVIEEAANGKEAFEQIQKSTPALVISDHKMPIMNGYELVKQIRVSDLKFKPPVIILSSDIIETIEEEYKALGVEFIFRKPVNLANFKSALDSSLKKAIINSYAS